MPLKGHFLSQALALFLVILHLRGVLTGTANATWVFLGTVIVPTAALFWETFQIRAVAWPLGATSVAAFWSQWLEGMRVTWISGEEHMKSPGFSLKNSFFFVFFFVFF